MPIVHESETTGGAPYGMYFKIKLEIENGRVLNQDERIMIRKACDSIQIALENESARLDPRTAESRERWLGAAKELFKGIVTEIHFHEIPNEYCNKACCLGEPWLEVYTGFGIFKIGWRKSVLVLDWSRTFINKEAETLFANEDVTKTNKMIHCWSYEKAKSYLLELIK